MRPGRIDRILYVPLPDATARQQIFLISLSKMKLSKDVDPQVLTIKTEGYSGAEIVQVTLWSFPSLMLWQVCSEAALHALRANFSTNEVSMNDFLSGLAAVPPRTTKEQIQFFTSYHQKFWNQCYLFSWWNKQAQVIFIGVEALSWWPFGNPWFRNLSLLAALEGS